MTAQQYIRSLAAEATQYQKVYKYVDYCGGMDMLRKSDIRFTSACALNDEYDCSSAVLNYNKYRELGIFTISTENWAFHWESPKM